MIETKQLDAEFGRALLRLAVIAGGDEKAAPWAFFGRIRHRHELGDRALGSEQRAAAFGRARVLAVRPHRRVARRRGRRPVPTKVPLVPRPATKWVSRPLVCSMISGAVVS